MSFGNASLCDEVDKKLIVVLRDGKKFIGVMRTFDQFANIILQDTIERIYVGDKYSDKHLGVFFIRGDTVVILGEIDPDKEVKEKKLTKVSWEEINLAQQAEREKLQQMEQTKRRIMTESGLTIDSILNLDDF
ncbi:LSM domain-containing protein [Heterostelium album PN500]|uniref:U6 snRNA-associated Sm-like protein LSm1 n=1 Tax=Heterostelium pallidum (strain ATCC 26659 / Pp 5 / PN500) TaxID=670386 RepID=D3B0J7_HETP5|nr:LSM domain-containing protein [Heterostelium album PN500]EFA84821.1 LSM domain-containing protein [Heterostelium album PN500]|eukprot:XP_020436932.1 LSM domain-containing protein [Heterostelium album PN500]